MLNNLLIILGFRRKFKVGDEVTIGSYEKWEKPAKYTILEVGKSSYRVTRHLDYQGKDLSYETTIRFGSECIYEKL